LFGVAATPIANRHSTEFVLTWPLSLLAIHQIAVAALRWSKQTDRTRSAAWAGGAAFVLLVAAALSYFAITRSLSLAPAWYFLLTFLPAWPLALPAAWRLTRPGGLLGDFLGMLAAFSLYFWLAGGLMLLRTALSG
jgi:hypothetical protein